MPPFEIDPAQYSAPYREQEDILIAQEQAHRQSALDYLQQSLASQRDIRPSQGIAAALLAAIPTLGGALLGKAVGQSEVPDGVYGVKLSPTGANAGGMAGAEIGGKAAGDYFGAIEADNLHAQKVNAARAQLEDQNADRLGQQANQYQLRALDTEAKLNLLPVEMRQYQQQLDMQRSSQIAGHIAQREYDIANPLSTDVSEARAKNAETNAERLRARLTGNEPLKPSANVMVKVAAADAVAQGQERLRQLYKVAAEQIGPGFIQSFARKGLSALPANVQQEFAGTLKSVAMQMNKAVDPTPSDAGMLAQYQKLEASIANGHFLDALDFEVKNARRGALAELEPFTIGPNPNSQVQAMKNLYAEKWGLTQPLSKEDFFKKFFAERDAAKAAKGVQ